MLSMILNTAKNLIQNAMLFLGFVALKINHGIFYSISLYLLLVNIDLSHLEDVIPSPPLERWLEQLGMSHYLPSLQHQEYGTLATLSVLDEGTLDTLGITFICTSQAILEKSKRDELITVYFNSIFYSFL